MLLVIHCVQMVTRYKLQLQMGVAFMNYIMNVTILQQSEYPSDYSA